MVDDKREEVCSSPHHHERPHRTPGTNNYTNIVKVTEEVTKGRTTDHHATKEIPDRKGKAANRPELPARATEHRRSESKTPKDTSRPLDTSQIAATRTSLDHTINVSMSWLYRIYYHVKCISIGSINIILQFFTMPHVIFCSNKLV